MFIEMQKIIMKKVRKRVVICGAALIILLAVFGSSFLKLVQGPVDLYSLSIDELEGAYVEADVNAILDTFAEFTETDKYDNETIIKEYYIIPVGEAEYFGMGVRKSDFDKAVQISDETLEYLMGERSELTSSMHVKGTIKKMDEELSGYFYEWFEESNFLEHSSTEELERYALAYVMEPDEIGLFEESLVYMVLVVCVVLLIFMIVFIVQGASGSCLSRAKKFVKDNESTDSLEMIETDYQNAAAIEAVRVGKFYTFFFKGINACIVRNNDVIWAYLKRITHRTNGIKTHVTKQLMLHTRNKVIHSIDMRSEEGIAAALKQYSMNNPQIILGFSDELEKCYRRDINAFIDLSSRQEAASSNCAASGQDSAAAGQGGVAASATEQTGAAENGQNGAFASIILQNGGNNSIMVIKTIREILECGLEEAKDLVDNTPSVLLENIPLNDALAIKAALESSGAAVEIKE